MRASQAIALGFPALGGAYGRGLGPRVQVINPGSLGLTHEYSSDVGLTSKDFKLLTVFMCYRKENRWIRVLHLLPSIIIAT